jgi:hypothetical protein
MLAETLCPLHRGRTAGCSTAPSQILSVRNDRAGVLSFTTLAAIASRTGTDTGGWLILTRPGLSPGKKRQASLDALTSLLIAGAPLDERSNATTGYGAASGAAAS